VQLIGQQRMLQQEYSDQELETKRREAKRRALESRTVVTRLIPRPVFQFPSQPYQPLALELPTFQKSNYPRGVYTLIICTIRSSGEKRRRTYEASSAVGFMQQYINMIVEDPDLMHQDGTPAMDAIPHEKEVELYRPSPALRKKLNKHHDKLDKE